ncbi:hypothetical protein BgiBS90_006661 [Biomphalaria glabrata]|nr:hypothetical protein BgiBS90_006661 [Biomphalaria glabrata]
MILQHSSTKMTTSLQYSTKMVIYYHIKKKVLELSITNMDSHYYTTKIDTLNNIGLLHRALETRHSEKDIDIDSQAKVFKGDNMSEILIKINK